MEVVLEQKDGDDWIYRGEGAANLVLAYSGSSPTFVGKVLRIQKAPRIGSPRNGYDSEDSHSALTNDECLLWRETEDLVSAPTREIAEQLQVIGRALKDCVVCLGSHLDRMHKAIKALFVTTLNNFRVFLNGSLILGGLGGGADSTTCMIGDAFENVLNGVIQADSGQRTSNFLHLIPEAILDQGYWIGFSESRSLITLKSKGQFMHITI
ncbi:hypothetical protein RHGRI_019159 [Rhododendron griersonianum]|uniref:Inositol-pentakisphosphate 2-kinase n=1 Tax=Rhododendron griersonianum TaxID=479676 RepID=A0AAV6JGW9_9ERIC|nr:hypothetical protein RHGRI_019159 [Rhododendron griersonianum]